MYRAICIVTCLAVETLSMNSPQEADIHKLFARLNGPSTTNQAVHEIIEATTRNANTRQYIVQRLPDMINKQEPDSDVWRNAVDLAGQLKASETIPSLIKALSLGPTGGPMQTTFGTQMRLDNDIVAKALAEIGDPAIPAVRNLLTSQDKNTRRRAVLILRNMNSPPARKVLQEHLPHETDEITRELIETGLRESPVESAPKS